MKNKSLVFFGRMTRSIASLAVFFSLGSSTAFADVELEQQLKEVVMTDTGIGPEIKNKLISIIEKVTSENNEINTKIREQKVMLLKALLSKSSAPKEAKELKQSLIKLNDQRLDNSLKALESLKDVLGHQKNPEILFKKILELGGRY
ncbi:MAG: hypothetical protein KGP28_02335 [Bdellovibrionales bacterium]|nr:hypothetical protein [Bdellovibrionales bacterium]